MDSIPQLWRALVGTGNQNPKQRISLINKLTKAGVMHTRHANGVHELWREEVGIWERRQYRYAYIIVTDKVKEKGRAKRWVLRVPPGQYFRTKAEAVAWTFGVPAREWRKVRES